VHFQQLPTSVPSLHALISLFIFLLTLPNFAQEGSNPKPELVLQSGHSGKVLALSFSPDGRWLASGGRDKTVKLWETATGREVRTLIGHKNVVYALAFSPDGRLLASGSQDNTVKLWDVATGRELRTLDCGETIFSVAFSPDGRYLASPIGSSVDLWEVPTGRPLRTLIGHSDVGSVDFSPDGRWLASASIDATVSLWEVSSGSLVSTMTTHSDVINAIAFAPSGARLASGSRDGTVKLWEISTGQVLLSLVGHTADLRSVAFSPDGYSLISGGGDGVVERWEVATGREVSTQSGTSSVSAVAFSPDGRWMASASARDYTVSLRELSTARELRTLSGYGSSGVNAVAFSPDGRWMASASVDKTLKLWQIATGREVHTLTGFTAAVGAMAFSRDGRWLATANGDRTWMDIVNGDKTVKVWEVATGGEVHTLIGHTESVLAVAFSPDGRWLASASVDETVKLWDVATGRELRTLSGHASRVETVVFSPDSRWLASGSEDKTVKLWEVATGREVRTLTGHTAGISAVQFSPDGGSLASVSRDRMVKLWDVATGRELRTLQSQALWVDAVAFSADGHFLAGANDKKMVKLWDVATGREVQRLVGHAETINAVAFSPDGRCLTSGSLDGSIRVWDPSTGEALAQVTVVSGSNDWVVVTPEGLFDGSDEGTQKLVAWRMGNNTYPVDRFFNDYYSPGLLARIFSGERPKPNVDLADLKLPPQVHVTDPTSGTPIQEQRRTVTVEAQDEGGGVAEVRLYQNGKLIGTRPGASSAKLQYSFEVDLLPGENIIEASALSRERVESNKDQVRVVYERRAPSKPVLHLLVVGINEYEDPKFDLDYAQPDAEAIARFFEQHGGLFSSVDVVKLVDKQAAKASILQALQQLAQRAHPEDVVLIYMAGHGVALGEQFYFLAQGMRTEEDEEVAIREYGVSAQVLSDTLLQIGALKQILILDTCESGSALPILAKATMFRVRGLGTAEEKAVKMLARSNGYYLIAASTSEQDAHEVPELGHGVLTSALLSGLGEKGEPLAPTGPEGIVTIYALLQYVNQQVPELTEKYYHGNKQYPVSSNTGMDFPLRVR
jgi:WD40 repeat protein